MADSALKQREAGGLAEARGDRAVVSAIVPCGLYFIVGANYELQALPTNQKETMDRVVSHYLGWLSSDNEPRMTINDVQQHLCHNYAMALRSAKLYLNAQSDGSIHLTPRLTVVIDPSSLIVYNRTSGELRLELRGKNLACVNVSLRIGSENAEFVSILLATNTRSVVMLHADPQLAMQEATSVVSITNIFTERVTLYYLKLQITGGGPGCESLSTWQLPRAACAQFLFLSHDVRCADHRENLKRALLDLPGQLTGDDCVKMGKNPLGICARLLALLMLSGINMSTEDFDRNILSMARSPYGFLLLHEKDAASVSTAPGVEAVSSAVVRLSDNPLIILQVAPVWFPTVILAAARTMLSLTEDQPVEDFELELRRYNIKKLIEDYGLEQLRSWVHLARNGPSSGGDDARETWQSVFKVSGGDIVFSSLPPLVSFDDVLSFATSDEGCRSNRLHMFAATLPMSCYLMLAYQQLQVEAVALPKTFLQQILFMFHAPAEGLSQMMYDGRLRCVMERLALGNNVATNTVVELERVFHAASNSPEKMKALKLLAAEKMGDRSHKEDLVRFMESISVHCRIRKLLLEHSFIAVCGPQNCGKTSLAADCFGVEGVPSKTINTRDVKVRTLLPKFHVVDTPALNDGSETRNELTRLTLKMAKAVIVVLDAADTNSSSTLLLLKHVHDVNNVNPCKILFALNKVDALWASINTDMRNEDAQRRVTAMHGRVDDDDGCSEDSQASDNDNGCDDTDDAEHDAIVKAMFWRRLSQLRTEIVSSCPYVDVAAMWPSVVRAELSLPSTWLSDFDIDSANDTKDFSKNGTLHVTQLAPDKIYRALGLLVLCCHQLLRELLSDGDYATVRSLLLGPSARKLIRELQRLQGKEKKTT